MNQQSALHSVTKAAVNSALVTRSGLTKPPEVKSARDKELFNATDHLHGRDFSKVRVNPGPSSVPFIQRKCACGKEITGGGECDECRAKRLQAKLAVASADDSFEREADRIANQVVDGPAQSAAPTTPSPVSVQRVTSASASEGGMKDTPSSVNRVLQDSGRPLETPLRRDMENRFGHDFSHVRVHTGKAADQSARDVNANAYTVGRDIVFAENQFVPGTRQGRRLLAHELTHVMQQSSLKEFGPAGGDRISPRLPAARLQRQTKSTKCTDAEVTALNRNMHIHCNKPRNCSMQGDSCATATAKVAAGNACVDERTKLQQKCFSPGDPQYQNHMLQIAQASAALRNCITVMTAKCSAEAAAIAALAALAALTAAAAKKGAKAVIGKALIYAEVAAAFILLISGKAEAKISLGGDSALEALFKAMEQDGVPVPEEMKKMIESDPELKAMLEEAAKKGGNLTDVQKEVAQKYSEYINAHMDEFSKEELQMIMKSTDQVADKVPANLSVQNIKKALKEKSAEKDGGPKTDAKDTGTGATKPPVTDGGAATAVDKDKPPQTAGTGVSPADTQSPALKNLSEENKKKIQGAPSPVSKVFKEFAGGEVGGVKVDDAAVKKFFEIVPTELTDEQAERVIGLFESSQGMTLDAVLESLKQAIEKVRKGPAPTVGTATDGAASDQPAPSRDQVIQKLKEMAKKTNFSKISEGTYEIRNVSDKIVGGKISAYFYGKVNKIGVVGSITGTVPADLDITKLKRGSTFVITITSHSPFVDKNGTVHDFRLETKVTFEK